MADPNGPYAFRANDGDNDLLRKILNWLNALSAGSKVIPGGIVPVTPDDPGYSYYRNTALSATKQSVQVGESNLFSVNLVNVNTVPVYVKLYDGLVAGVTVGTTVPVLTIAIPAGDSITPGIVAGSIFEGPKHFATGIVVAAVTGLADSSTAAPTTPIHVNLQIK